MKNLEVKTSYTAVVARIVENVFYFIVMGFIIAGEFWWLHSLQGKYGCETIWGVFENYYVPTLVGVALILYSIVNIILVIILLIDTLPNLIWDWRFDLKRNTKIKENVVTQVEYSFPYDRDEETVICDQVTQINISQTFIDSQFGTGSIKITGVTRTNATAEEFVIHIPQIDNPSALKEKLMEYFSFNSPLLINNITKSEK